MTNLTKNQGQGAWLVGLMLMFGFPAIAWAFWGWKGALIVFVVPQFLLGLLKIISKR